MNRVCLVMSCMLVLRMPTRSAVRSTDDVLARPGRMLVGKRPDVVGDGVPEGVLPPTSVTQRHLYARM